MRDRDLFDQVAGALDASLVGASRLLGGSSASVWRLDLTAPGGDRAVVFRHHEPGSLKLHGVDVARREFRLLERLYELDFPVAEPLYHDAERGFLVTEFIHGESSVDPVAVSDALMQAARLLARIHRLDPMVLDGVGLNELEDPVESLPTYLPTSPAGRQLERALEHGVALYANPRGLIHGDFWPGNMLWRNGSLAALIDWEDAALGDPLADLASARVELLCEYGESAMQHFTSAYLETNTSLDTRSLPVWECYVSASALATMHRWGLEPADEANRRSTTAAFFAEATQAITR